MGDGTRGGGAGATTGECAGVGRADLICLGSELTGDTSACGLLAFGTTALGGVKDGGSLWGATERRRAPSTTPPANASGHGAYQTIGDSGNI